MKKYLILNRGLRRAGTVAMLLTLGLGSSCSKFLDVAPQGQAATTQFFQTAADAAAASGATYAKLREWNLIAFNWLAITTLTSDDAEKGSVSGDAEFLNDFTFFRLSSASSPLDGYWVGQYQQVNLCNQVIKNVPGINMDASLRTRYVAEAKFLRALAYFNLVRAFGGVPLILQPVTADTQDLLNPTRASAADVYAAIVQDLTDATTILPVSYASADVGRATKGAAYALLAKVQLYNKNYAAAQAAVAQVTGYSLVSDYYSMFRIRGENGPESIFEIMCSTIPGNCDASNSQWAQVQGVRPQFGWGFFNPSTSLESAFEAGDQRKAGTILYRGQTTPDGDVIDPNSANPRYNMKAYTPNSVSKVCNYGSDQNVRVLRYAEVLLINAEASNELGQTATAMGYVNQVRKRAGLAALGTGLSQTAARQAIWQERRVELALEYGDRFFDLVRQGNAATVLASKGFVAGKNELMPIPLTEITLSGGKLTQNPGY